MNVETFQVIRREWRQLEAFERGREEGRLEIASFVLEAAEARLESLIVASDRRLFEN